MAKTWADFFWPLRRLVLPLGAVLLVYLVVRIFNLLGISIPISLAYKTRLLLGASTIGAVIGLAYGYLTYKPRRVTVIAPANEEWTAWALWEIPPRFLVRPEGRPARLIYEPSGDESEAWLAEKVLVLRQGDEIVTALEPSRIHDPLTRVIDRKAIDRVATEAEKRLEEALNGYVLRRTGTRLEARRLLSKLLGLERKLEDEWRKEAKGEET